MERKNGSLYSFIPMPLVIEGRPELNIFSYNVLIAMYRVNSEGKTEMGSVVYEPDLSTYRDSGVVKILSYLNIYNPDYRLDISFDTQEKTYHCDKYNREERLGIATGNEWNQFFIHVGILGLANGEACMFKEIKQQN